MHWHESHWHCHGLTWVDSPLSQYWHAGFWPLWPKHHCVQNATVTKTPPNIYATKNFRHCDQNATQNFRHASNNHRRIFLISFSECIHRMHSTNNIKNMYFYIFGIISLPCFINSLPSANITNNHLDTTLIYLVTTLQWYKSLS